MSNGITLLLVDDEPVIRLAVQEFLEEGGYEVVTAANGDEAAAILKNADFALSALITDIRLGVGLNGWELSRQAREANADICVIYITGDSAADWPVEGVSKSVVLQKPFVGARLVTLVAMMLTEQVGSFSKAS